MRYAIWIEKMPTFPLPELEFADWETEKLLSIAHMVARDVKCPPVEHTKKKETSVRGTLPT